jgi:hypothetical protein
MKDICLTILLYFGLYDNTYWKPNIKISIIIIIIIIILTFDYGNPQKVTCALVECFIYEFAYLEKFHQ